MDTSDLRSDRDFWGSCKART